MTTNKKAEKVLPEGAMVFHDFMRGVGFNKKQVAAAGRLMGWARQNALNRSSGKVRVTDAERLGMMAAALGIPAWEFGDADVVDEDCRVLARALRDRIMANRDLARAERKPP